MRGDGSFIVNTAVVKEAVNCVSRIRGELSEEFRRGKEEDFI